MTVQLLHKEILSVCGFGLGYQASVTHNIVAAVQKLQRVTEVNILKDACESERSPGLLENPVEDDGRRRSKSKIGQARKEHDDYDGDVGDPAVKKRSPSEKSARPEAGCRHLREGANYLFVLRSTLG